MPALRFAGAAAGDGALLPPAGRRAGRPESRPAGPRAVSASAGAPGPAGRGRRSCRDPGWTARVASEGGLVCISSGHGPNTLRAAVTQVGGRAQRAAGARLAPGARSSRSAPLLVAAGLTVGTEGSRRPAGGARDAAGPAGPPVAAVRGAGTGQRALRTARCRRGPDLSWPDAAVRICCSSCSCRCSEGRVPPFPSPPFTSSKLSVSACGLGEVPRPEHWPGFWGPPEFQWLSPQGGLACSGKNWRTWPVLTSPVTPGASSRLHNGLPRLSGRGVDSIFWAEGLSNFVDMVQKPHEFSQKRGNCKNVTEVYSI